MTARIVRRGPDATREAIRLMSRGEVVVLPSTLLYGLFCDATSRDAVDRVAALKSRRERLPLPILASPQSAGRYARLPETVQRAVELAWPGGMSFVVPRLPTVPEHVTGSDTVMLFCPDPWLEEVADRAGFPIAGTSANAAGDPPSLTAADAHARFGKDVDLVVDGGTSRFGRSTTIVDATARPTRVLRESVVPMEAVRRHFPDAVR